MNILAWHWQSRNVAGTSFHGPGAAQALLAATLFSLSAARAATLQVGPDADLKLPSAAAARAQNGDTVAIAPGTYFDCAVWTQDGLTIEGTGPGVVLTDKPCGGKASFVVRGTGVTIRNLTFTRIRVPDRNGAGIRAEGHDLTVADSRFINDQIGILAADAMPSAITVLNCDFSDNGLSDGAPTAADLLIGRVSSLHVGRSRFGPDRDGAAISSAALHTELADSHIIAGGLVVFPYAVGALSGGTLDISDTILELAPGTLPRIGMIAMANDGDLPAGDVSLDRIILRNHANHGVILLRNWSGLAPHLHANLLSPRDTEVTSDGASLHRLKQTAHRFIEWLDATKRAARHTAALVWHRWH